MSFSDYKINYSNRLGSGVFGTVYEVIRRPENEKGIFSYLFPYVYDSIFLVDEKKSVEKTDLCIKISKSTFRIFLENTYTHPTPLMLALRCFHQFKQEQKTNTILRKYGLSKILFIKTSGFYSQFKTVVRGHTFDFYLSKDYFVNSGQFELRKVFVNFLRAILNANVDFEDIHKKNVMYDELEYRWEIVDGYVSEKEIVIQESKKTQVSEAKNPDNPQEPSDNITQLLGFMNLDLPSNQKTQYVFRKLSKVARSGLAYNQNKDQKLLKKVISH